MKNHAYLVLLSSNLRRGDQMIVSAWPGLVVAQSAEVAYAQATIACMARFAEDDGWQCQDVLVLPLEDARAVALAGLILREGEEVVDA